MPHYSNELINQRLRAIQERLEGFEQSAQRVAVQMTDTAAMLSPYRLYRALEKSIPELQPVIRKQILANYRTSGLGASPRSHEKDRGNAQPHGWLEKLVNQTTVKLISKMSKTDGAVVPIIEVTLGGTNTSGKQFEIVGALNWGAVHLKQSLREPYDPANKIRVPESVRAAAGAAAKRTLKKTAFTGSASLKALNAVRRGAVFHGVRVTKGLANPDKAFTRSGGRKKRQEAIWLGKEESAHGWAALPHPFFYFTAAQVQEIQGVMDNSIQQEIDHAS